MVEHRGGRRSPSLFVHPVACWPVSSFRLTGCLLSSALPMLDEAFLRLLSARELPVVVELDLDDVRSADQAAAEGLVAWMRRLRRRGCRVVTHCRQPAVVAVLGRSGLRVEAPRIPARRVGPGAPLRVSTDRRVA